MTTEKQYGAIHGAVKTRITFFDLNPAGGQKVISGFCSGSSSQVVKVQIFKQIKTTLNNLFLV